MTLEEKILAYLDGSLDEDSSAELLHSLSTSPEKRALLEEHLRLRNMMALGQKPFAIPTATERTLAARIPALAGREDFAARLVRPSALSTLFAGASEWFGSLIQAPVARWGLGLASLAAVGLTAWLLNTAPNLSSPIATNTPAIQGPASVSMVGPNESVSLSSVKKSRQHLSSRRPEQIRIPESNVAHSLETSQPPTTNLIFENIAAIPVSPDAFVSSDVGAPVIPHVGAPLSASMPPGFSVTLGYAQYQYQLPGVGSTVTATGSHPEIGVSYELSPHFAVRAEGGIASHPSFETTAKTERVTSIGGQSYSRVVYGTNVTTSDAAFSRLGFEYVLNPGASYELRMSGTGGVQFAGSLIPTASVVAGISHPLGALFALDLSAIYTGTWGQSSEIATSVATVDGSNGVVGLVHGEAPIPSTVFAPAFGVCAGLRYHF